MSETRERELPAHVTTPLLTLITTRSLDEDYAHVAARRDPSQEPGSAPSRRPGWRTVAVVAVFGLLATMVLVQTSRRSEVDELSRAALIEQIGTQREQVTALQAAVEALVTENRKLVVRNESSSTRLSAASARVTRLEVRTGYAAVQGPGVRINVANPPDADANTEIRDEDLATLVDGLWEAGAEAIAINGQRINVLGGIRNTDRAVHINGKPIRAPYVVTAIGDRATLQARLAETSQGQEWFAHVNGLSWQYSAQNVDDVEVPAAPLRRLRAADVVPVPDELSPEEEGIS